MVQDFGLNLLLRQENLDRQEAEENAIRNALLAAGRAPHLVYPDIFSDPHVEEVDLEADADALFREDVAYDYSGVQALDPADFERDQAAMLDSLMESDQITVVEDGAWI